MKWFETAQCRGRLNGDRPRPGLDCCPRVGLWPCLPGCIRNPGGAGRPRWRAHKDHGYTYPSERLARTSDTAGAGRAYWVSLDNRPENKRRPGQAQGVSVDPGSSTLGVLHLGKFLHRYTLPAVSPRPCTLKHLGRAKPGQGN